MDVYELNIDKNANYDGYDETVDPTLFNVFGAAAFRMGHSLAPVRVQVINILTNTFFLFIFSRRLPFTENRVCRIYL